MYINELLLNLFKDLFIYTLLIIVANLQKGFCLKHVGGLFALSN